MEEHDAPIRKKSHEEVLTVLVELVNAFHKYEMGMDSDCQPLRHRSMIQRAEKLIESIRGDE
ncbi:MAG TPA: hypothetical protein VMW91_02280 [Desulfosporosinus sp.]|nr:hypothetical protein [Desulfosporosinus sp.]